MGKTGNRRKTATTIALQKFGVYEQLESIPQYLSCSLLSPLDVELTAEKGATGERLFGGDIIIAD